MYYKNRDIEREEKVLELYRKGMTCTNIEKALGINRRSVYRILNRNKVSLVKTINNECDICGGEIRNNTKNRTRCGSCQTKLRRYIIKVNAVAYKGGKCERCNWSGDLSGYDFHHINSSLKKFSISAEKLTSKKWKDIIAELNKCELLCALCHRLEHSDYRNEKMLSLAKVKKKKHWEKEELIKCLNDSKYFR